MLIKRDIFVLWYLAFIPQRFDVRISFSCLIIHATLLQKKTPFNYAKLWYVSQPNELHDAGNANFHTIAVLCA